MYLSDLVKIHNLAAILAEVSKNETRSSLVALAWTLRNREKNRKSAQKKSKTGTNNMFCHETISNRGRSITSRSWNIAAFLKLKLGENYGRSLVIASLVWCGEEADPTAGSTHFHRHDDWPEWAINSEPVALIGNWFFYNQIDVQR